MFEPTVQGLGGAIRGAGPVEVGEDVSGPLVQGAAQHDSLLQSGGDTAADGVDDGLHADASRGPVGFPVGSDHLLVDAPGGLDLDVVIAGEQGL